MLTPEGQSFAAAAILAEIEEAKAVTIVVGDGSQTAEAQLDEGFPKLSEDAKSIVFQATFGPEEANFEWQGEGISIDGKRVEWEERDAGRKALGATWTVEIAIDLTP